MERYDTVKRLLSKRRYKFNDLQQAAGIESPISLNRILKDMEIKGIAQQDKKRAPWYRSDIEYEVDRYLKHSLDLIPVLDFLRTVPFENIARQELLLKDAVKDNKYVEKPKVPFRCDKPEYLEAYWDKLKFFEHIDQTHSYLPRDTRAEKEQEDTINFSIEQYCAVKEHLQHGIYHNITEPFNQIMQNYFEMDEFLRKRKNILNSEKYKQLEQTTYKLARFILSEFFLIATAYFIFYEPDQQKKTELRTELEIDGQRFEDFDDFILIKIKIPYEKLVKRRQTREEYDKFVSEEREKLRKKLEIKGQRFEDYLKQYKEYHDKLNNEKIKLRRLQRECARLIIQSRAYKVKQGKLRRAMLDRFDGDIKRLIESVKNGVALYGECHICKEFNQEEDKSPLSTGHYFKE
jgi:hypothetical protein